MGGRGAAVVVKDTPSSQTQSSVWYRLNASAPNIVNITTVAETYIFSLLEDESFCSLLPDKQMFTKRSKAKMRTQIPVPYSLRRCTNKSGKHLHQKKGTCSGM